MPLLLLIRHGENDFVKTDKVAGRLEMRREAQRKALGIERREDIPELSQEKINGLKRQIK